MKTKTKFTLCCLAAALVVTGLAQTVPQLINYQGKLTDATGIELPTADYRLSFSVYDAAQAGTRVWGPQTLPTIPVVKGNFNVMLGPVDDSARSISTAFSAANRWIEITVGSNSPILPRQQILSAPFALQSADSAKLAGYDWTALFGVNSPAGEILESKIGDGSLAGAKIKPVSITADRIAPKSLASGQIADNSIQAAQLANATITANQIGIGAIAGANLANGAVGSAQLSTGAVQSGNLASGAVTQDKLAPPVYALSGSCGNWSATGDLATYQPVANLNVTVESLGRPMFAILVSTDPVEPGLINALRAECCANIEVALTRDGQIVSKQYSNGHGPGIYSAKSASSFAFFDPQPPKGRRTYSISVRGPGDSVLTVNYCNLLIFSL